MDDLPKMKRAKGKDYIHPVALLRFLDHHGFGILDDHKHILFHKRSSNTDLDGSAEAEDVFKNKSSPLASGVGHNKDDGILSIIAAYANRRGFSGRTPLHVSVDKRITRLLVIFLAAGADVDAEDKDKETPLHKSAWAGHTDIVDILIKAGANVDAEDKYKETPLHKSAWAGHTDIVDILLKAGANVDAEDEDKETPLHYSARAGHKDIVEILLNAGANVHAEDNFKYKSSHYSIYFHHDDITELLLRAGAFVKKISSFYESVWNLMFPSLMGIELTHVSKLSSIHNWIYYVTSKKKSVMGSRSTTIEIERTEIVRAIFIDSDNQTFRNEDSSSNNGGISNDGPTLLTSGTSLSSSAKTSSSSESFCAPPTAAESHDLDDTERQDLNNLRQEFQDYVAKFSPEHIESWGTISSSDVKAAFLAGRIVMPTTMHVTKNITNIKKIKKTYNYGPGTNLDIKQAIGVAPYGKVVVHKNRSTTDDDDDEDEDDSSSEDGSNTNVKGPARKVKD